VEESWASNDPLVGVTPRGYVVRSVTAALPLKMASSWAVASSGQGSNQPGDRSTSKRRFIPRVPSWPNRRPIRQHRPSKWRRSMWWRLRSRRKPLGPAESILVQPKWWRLWSGDGNLDGDGTFKLETARHPNRRGGVNRDGINGDPRSGVTGSSQELPILVVCASPQDQLPFRAPVRTALVGLLGRNSPLPPGSVPFSHDLGITSRIGCFKSLEQETTR
jgi:hypothetical protein